MDTLRILIIAADPLARAGLALMLERQPGCQVVGQTAGLADLPSSLELYQPDVALVDLGVNFDLRPDAIDLPVALPVVYLLPGGSPPDVQALVLAGWGALRELESAPMPPGSFQKRPGRAFLGREASTESIAHAFFSVADGLLVVDPGIGNRESRFESRGSRIESREARIGVGGQGGDNTSLRQLDSRLVADGSRLSNPDSRTYEELTPRELEVLGLIAEGMANKRIAQTLGISEHTVKYHINTILGKLGAESRTEAVTRAARLGWLTL